MRSLPSVFLLTALSAVPAIPASATSLYWTEQTGGGPSTNTVQLGTTTGGPASPAYTRTPGGANGIEALGGQLYLPDQVAGVITRINPDGTGALDLVTGINPYDVDLEGGYLYWAEQNSNAIRRISADGSGAAALVFSPANPVALDVTSTAIFYAEFNNRLLRRADSTGNNAVTLVSGQEIRDIEVIGDLVYFVGYNPRTFATAIQRVNSDGTGLQVILGGLGFGNGIDVTDDAIFFSDLFGAISRVNLDGTGQQQLYSGPFGGTRGVAVLETVVPLPAAGWLLGSAVALLGRRRSRQA